MKTIEGYTQREIASRLNVTRQAVSFMAKKHKWRVVGTVGFIKLYSTKDVEKTLMERFEKHGAR